MTAMRFTVRTPHDVTFDASVVSARVPTETGQVGLRPREEPMLLVIEPGLVLLRTPRGMRYAASAGGLLLCDRSGSVLYTPFAVTGENDAEVLERLERALTAPDSELRARRELGELEQRIVRQLREAPVVSRRPG